VEEAQSDGDQSDKAPKKKADQEQSKDNGHDSPTEFKPPKKKRRDIEKCMDEEELKETSLKIESPTKREDLSD